MQTEAPMSLRAIDPQKIVPNFINWLSDVGEVEFTKGKLGRSKFNGGLWKPGEIRRSLKVAIKLRGVPIGNLEFFTNPPAVFYEGERLNQSISRGRRRLLPNTINMWYVWDHPLAYQTGRGDGWEIPFP